MWNRNLCAMNAPIFVIVCSWGNNNICTHHDHNNDTNNVPWQVHEPDVKELNWKALEWEFWTCIDGSWKERRNVLMETSGWDIGEIGRTVKKRCFSRFVVSKWNVVFAYNVVKMMLPHDCYPLLEKKTLFTKATSLVIIEALHNHVASVATVTTPPWHRASKTIWPPNFTVNAYRLSQNIVKP